MGYSGFALVGGGERGIRTPGGVTLNGFQDRRNRPLCHLSFVLTSAKVEVIFELCKFFAIFFENIFQPLLERWTNIDITECYYGI